MSLGHAWEEGRQAWNRLCRDPNGPADGDGALVDLSDIGTVRRALEHAELQAVRIARRHRKSWSEIAVQLGVTRQSAWERWRDVDEQSPGATSGRPTDAKTVVVPDVVGYTWVEARHTLNQAGLVAVQAVPQETPSASHDWIVSDQSPPAGTTVKNGSGVRLWLDRGGGAGVREPRRPRPTPKPARAMRPEPT
jgi:PASTA domain-containing protein